jgi:anti-anti-sigma factor
MKLTITRPDDLGPLHLAGDLDIYSAGDLHETLSRHLRDDPALALDLSGVVSCDPVAAQLLCSARRSAAAADKPFRVLNVSEPVARTCAALGLASEQISLS